MNAFLIHVRMAPASILPVATDAIVSLGGRVPTVIKISTSASPTMVGVTATRSVLTSKELGPVPVSPDISAMESIVATAMSVPTIPAIRTHPA